MVAQDVERAFPELVETGSDGYKRVRYGVEFDVLLLPAVKEQQALIDAQPAELAALRERVAVLEAVELGE